MKRKVSKEIIRNTSQIERCGVDIRTTYKKTGGTNNKDDKSLTFHFAELIYVSNIIIFTKKR